MGVAMALQIVALSVTRTMMGQGEKHKGELWAMEEFLRAHGEP